MKISGFTFVKNADKFYFPIRESILSILPIVDEFVIAMGVNDPGDRTEDLIRSIGSEKIRIIPHAWDKQAMEDGRIYADETNFALDHCSGDWCFYLQADECIHEDDLPKIVEACKQNQNREEIDALLFNYRHFWGDYQHHLPYHGWYRNEIRLIKNNRNIRSIRDAQSFRKLMKDGTEQKLQVVETDIYVYHYGWVRPPSIMQNKKKEQDVVHYKTKKASEVTQNYYNYGAMGRIPKYTGSHPAVMQEWMAKHDWSDQLNFTNKANLDRDLFKHERLKYRIISWLENNLNGGKTILGYKNWVIKK